MERIEQDIDQTAPDAGPDTGVPAQAVAAPARPASKALARSQARGDAPAQVRAEVRGVEPRHAVEGARHDARLPGGSVLPVAALPPIPAKRYFTIGEVSDLCAVKPYVLRYWEQEFTQLRPMKRRGNRRYYQHHEVLLIRRIRELLYEQGFTISGARNQLHDHVAPAAPVEAASVQEGVPAYGKGVPVAGLADWGLGIDLGELSRQQPQAAAQLREALLSIRDLLS